MTLFVKPKGFGGGADALISVLSAAPPRTGPRSPPSKGSGTGPSPLWDSAAGRHRYHRSADTAPYFRNSLPRIYSFWPELLGIPAQQSVTGSLPAVEIDKTGKKQPTDKWTTYPGHLSEFETCNPINLVEFDVRLFPAVHSYSPEHHIHIVFLCYFHCFFIWLGDVKIKVLLRN